MSIPHGYPAPLWNGENRRHAGCTTSRQLLSAAPNSALHPGSRTRLDPYRPAWTGTYWHAGWHTAPLFRRRKPSPQTKSKRPLHVGACLEPRGRKPLRFSSQNVVRSDGTLSYEMTHEAQSFLFADISGSFFLTELDGDEALVRPQARSKATAGTRLQQRWSQRSESCGVGSDGLGRPLAGHRTKGGARCAHRPSL